MGESWKLFGGIGLGAGLMYFLGARLARGAPLIVEAAGLDEALHEAWAVLTGEGRVDAQTAYGKGPVEVARRARAMGVRAFLLAGSAGDGWEAVLDEGVTLVETLSPPGQDLSVSEMESRAADLLTLVAERTCHRVFGM